MHAIDGGQVWLQRPCAHAVGRDDVGRKPAQHGDRRSRNRLWAVGLRIAPAYKAGEMVTIILGGRRRQRARESREMISSDSGVTFAEQLAPAAAHRLRPHGSLSELPNGRVARWYGRSWPLGLTRIELLFECGDPV
jgi:hypothetical protein